MSLQPTESQIRVVIADDHSIFREGLCRVLEAEREFTVVGEAGTEQETLELVRYLRADILLLGFSMQGQATSEILRQISNISPSLRTILLTDLMEKPVMLQALLLGARGVVPKVSASAMLFKGIRAVMAGEVWVSRNAVPDLIEMLRARSQARRAASRSFDLTRRELEVIGAVVQGHFNKEIAQDFHISEDTVKHHLTRIFDKLGVSNRVELAMFASHHNLVKVSPGLRSNESLKRV